jgi:hypothetical protein
MPPRPTGFGNRDRFELKRQDWIALGPADKVHRECRQWGMAYSSAML